MIFIGKVYYAKDSTKSYSYTIVVCNSVEYSIHSNPLECKKVRSQKRGRVGPSEAPESAADR